MMAIEEVYLHPEDYDLELASRQVDDLAFWLELLRRERPVQVLEIGCGTGRLTIPLAREGARRNFAVTGLEPEAPMLQRARIRRQQEPLAVRAALRLVPGDIRRMGLPAHYDVALMPYGAAHHLLELDEQIAAWQNVRRHLTPGGLFCIDVDAPKLPALARAQHGTPRSQDIDTAGPDGRRLRRSVATRYNPAEQRAVHDFEYEATEPNGARRCYQSPFEMHVYYPRELELLCRMTGFRLERMVGSYDGAPFDERARLMIALARAV